MSLSPRIKTVLTGMFLVMLLIPFHALAQSTSIRGKVTDPEGNPVQSASVSIKGTSIGTTTLADGTFTLTFTKKGGEILSVSYVGFTDQEIPIGTTTEFNVKLGRTDQSLNAVVVVGYGTQRKRDVTGSVVSVDKKRLENMPNTNLLQALEGALPGVSVNTNGGGAEGNSMSITVRGQRSINGNTSALVILDGIPYNGSFFRHQSFRYRIGRSIKRRIGSRYLWRQEC